MLVYLFRHPSTIEGEKGLLLGHKHGIISSLGHCQLARLLNTITDLPRPEIIYSSDLWRCKEMGNGMSQKLHVPLFLDARLRETHFGIYQHCPLETLTQVRKNADFINFKPAEGESVNEVFSRVKQCFVALFKRYKNRIIFVITHSGVIKIVISANLLLKVVDVFEGFEIKPASFQLCRIEAPSKWRLL